MITDDNLRHHPGITLGVITELSELGEHIGNRIKIVMQVGVLEVIRPKIGRNKLSPFISGGEIDLGRLIQEQDRWNLALLRPHRKLVVKRSPNT